MTTGIGGFPLICNLAGEDLDARFHRIRALSKRGLLRHHREHRQLRLDYAPAVEEELHVLVDEEKRCCAFLDFAVRRDPDAVVLTITAPQDAGEFTPILFDHFVLSAEVDTVERAATPSCGCTARRSGT